MAKKKGTKKKLRGKKKINHAKAKKYHKFVEAAQGSERTKGKPEKPGIYILYWKSGGCSMSAVGRTGKGTLWFTPTNWTCDGEKMEASTSWKLVKAHQLIAQYSD